MSLIQFMFSIRKWKKRKHTEEMEVTNIYDLTMFSRQQWK